MVVHPWMTITVFTPLHWVCLSQYILLVVVSYLGYRTPALDAQAIIRRITSVSRVEGAVCLLGICQGPRAFADVSFAIIVRSVGRVVMLSVWGVNLFGRSGRNISIGGFIGGVELS
jgi:hypothetical protein